MLTKKFNLTREVEIFFLRLLPTFLIQFRGEAFNEKNTCVYEYAQGIVL